MRETGVRGSRLSLQQERLWTLMQKKNRYYVQMCCSILQGNLDPRNFQYALQQVVERHEILQTVFYCLPEMDTPLQVIGQQFQIDCPTINLEALYRAEQDVQLDTCFTIAQKQSFDLAHGPLLRLALFRLSRDVQVFLVALPALCADATTLSLFMREVAHFYHGCFQWECEIKEEALQYMVAAAWQRKILASENAKTPQKYWSRIDLSQITKKHVPFEIAGAMVESGASELVMPHQLSLVLDDDLCERIHGIAHQYGVSISDVFLACWYIVLYRLTDVPDQLIGVAADGRTSGEFKDAMGLYTRFLPVEIYIDRKNSFERILATVHHAVQEAMKWQLYFIWPETGAQNEPQKNYFPVQFAYENWLTSSTDADLAFQFSRQFSYTEPFKLRLSVLQIGGRLHLEFCAGPHSIVEEYVSQVSSVFRTFLCDVVAHHERPVNVLRLLSVDEQERLIEVFCGSAQVYESNLAHLFELQVARTPDLPALVDKNEELTYQEANRRANQLARVLRRQGVGPHVVVGLRLARCAQVLVSIVAILKAGGAYMPLDAETPSTRLIYQLQDAQVSLLLTQQSMLEDLSAWGGESVCMETLQKAAIQESDTNLQMVSEGGDLAYVMYTSGSTGTPKGVMVQQQSLANYALAMCKVLRCEPGWQFATVSTVAADLGNTAIFCALFSGGCIQVLDYETVTSSAAFTRWSIHHPIDVLKIVPSHLSALLASDEYGRSVLPRRALILGGESLPPELVWRVQKQAKNCKIYNHYGPTETTVGVLVNALKIPVNEEQRGEIVDVQGGIPLGKPIANMEAYILDQSLQIVSVGVVGELYLGGPGVALGYIHQPEQTATHFVPHPFSKQPGSRLYRTGDLVRYTLQDQIAFVTRRDQQIKMRGYRIELEEIERVLRRHPQIRDVVVLLHEDAPGGPYLLAYIVVRQLPAPSSDVLQDFLRIYLPAYMIPATFISLKALPLTANGKVDRHQLFSGSEYSSMMEVTGRTSKECVLPRDMIELQLVQIWEKLLQVQYVSVTDNFFELGGHSILAVRLIAHILQQFGQDLLLSAIFLHPTIANLAAVLRQKDVHKNQSPLAVIQPEGANPVLFCVHPSGGIVASFLHLARHLAPTQPFYGLQTTGFTQVEDSISSLEDLAGHYVKAIQEVQPQGPYLLGGWSMGGVVAFEMAQQLLRQGHEIVTLIIIDSRLPDAKLRTQAIQEDQDLDDEDFARMMVANLKIELPAEFQQVEREKRVVYVFELAKKMSGIPDDFDLEQVRRVFRVIRKHTLLAHIYTPERYPRHIDYFMSSPSGYRDQASAKQEEEAENSSALDTVGLWYEVADGGLAVHKMPGGHREMLEEPHVQVFATKLKQCIADACSRLLP